MTAIDNFNRELREFINGIYPSETKTLVFGCGNAKSDIMLIGEAPGEQESLQQKPFVGKAGKNLDYFLEKTGFERADLYITNTVKFRPVKISKSGNAVNRAPTPEEVALFLPWLEREIGIIKPKCAVTMGNTALKALLGKPAVIGDAHGKFFKRGDTLIFALYHPASLIYNKSLIKTYENDLNTLAAWRVGGNI